MRVAQWHRRSLPDLLRNRDQIRGAFTRPLSENGRRLADSPTVSRRKSHRNRGSSQKTRRNNLAQRHGRESRECPPRHPPPPKKNRPASPGQKTRLAPQLREAN